MDQKRLVPLSLRSRGPDLKPGRLHAAEFDETRRERNVLPRIDTIQVTGQECTISISLRLPLPVRRFISRNGYGTQRRARLCSKRLPVSVKPTRSWFPGCTGGLPNQRRLPGAWYGAFPAGR